MYLVKTKEPRLAYDIHSLVKAFFPEQDVKVLSPETVKADRAAGDMAPDMEILFEADVVRINCGAGENFSEKLETGEPASPENKRILKVLLYQVLCKLTGKTLPWGNLIGIRPTKIAMTMLEEGKTEAEIRDFMRTEHFVSEGKIALSLDIAKRERQLLSGLNGGSGYSLYIGIPFCPTTCLYCSFTSFPICSFKNRVGEYLTALEKEIDFTADFYRDKAPDTIYIGGGTPTTLEAEELERLLTKLERSFDLSRIREFTVEAGRADSITREKLETLRRHSVTRISINPQTMKEETLRLIGRQATAKQTKEAFYLARELGFDNINMDIILGLPGETPEDVRATIEEIKRLSPDSLTVHSLAVKRASRLHRQIEEYGVAALCNTDETMQIAAAGAEALSMQPYYLYRQKNMAGNFENVGYAREGKYGLYNVLIMEEVQTIVALGAGTISKRVYPDGRIERCDTVKDVAGYIERIGEMIERKRGLLED